MMFAKTIATELRAPRGQGAGELDLVHEPGSDAVRFAGAKGAVAWQGSANRHRAHGGGTVALEQVYAAGKHLVGVEDPTQHFVLPDVMAKLPFRSFATKKRASRIMAKMGEELKRAPEFQRAPELKRAPKLVTRGADYPNSWRDKATWK